jgi:adenylate cyclase
LVVAEIELPNEDKAFEKPDWLGKEVTSDRRYSNASLVKLPFQKWPDFSERGPLISAQTEQNDCRG